MQSCYFCGIEISNYTTCPCCICGKVSKSSWIFVLHKKGVHSFLVYFCLFLLSWRLKWKLYAGISHTIHARKIQNINYSYYMKTDSWSSCTCLFCDNRLLLGGPQFSPAIISLLWISSNYSLFQSFFVIAYFVVNVNKEIV